METASRRLATARGRACRQHASPGHLRAAPRHGALPPHLRPHAAQHDRVLEDVRRRGVRAVPGAGHALKNLRHVAEEELVCGEGKGALVCPVTHQPACGEAHTVRQARGGMHRPGCQRNGIAGAPSSKEGCAHPCGPSLPWAAHPTLATAAAGNGPGLACEARRAVVMADSAPGGELWRGVERGARLEKHQGCNRGCMQPLARAPKRRSRIPQQHRRPQRFNAALQCLPQAPAARCLPAAAAGAPAVAAATGRALERMAGAQTPTLPAPARRQE